MVWVEKANTCISRRLRHYGEINRPVGAILYVPAEGYKWEDIWPENWKYLPIDTIYIQGIDPEMFTSVLMDEFIRYGPIVALMRNRLTGKNRGQEEVEMRKYMFIQYEHWASAWNAVKESHGHMLMGHVINVEISDRTLDKTKGRETMCVWDELYDNWLVDEELQLLLI